MTALTLFVCRCLLRLAPASFRARFAREILDDLSQLASTGSAPSPLAAVGDVWSTVRRERRAGSAGVWSNLGGDVTYAWRGWRRSPGFTATLLITLAVGLGLSAAIFSFADGYLFRPLPFPGSDRAYNVRDPNATPAALKASDVVALRESPVAAYGFVEWDSGDIFGAVTIGTSTVSVSSYEVSPGFRQVMTLPLLAGRDFTQDDHAEGAPVVAWLSHRFWSRHLHSDRSVVGQTLRVDGVRGPLDVHIVGILGSSVSSFDLNNRPPDLVVPKQGPMVTGPNRLSSPMVLLPPDVSAEVAGERIASVLQAVAPAADGRPRAVRLVPVRNYQVAGGTPTARVFFAGALLVMTLATLNVIHLLLARGAARAREIQLRVSLGASRWRIARSCLVESVLLATGGIGLGLAVGRGLNALIAAAVPDMPTAGRNLALVPMLFDIRVVVFAVGLGLVVALLGGVWPAWQAMGHAAAMGGRMTRTRHRTSKGLLISQLTVATTIVIGTAFIGLGIYRYLNQPLGVDLDDRFSIVVSGADGRILSGEPAAAVTAALRAVAGISAITVTDSRGIQDPIEVDGQAYTPAQLGAGRAWPSFREARGLDLQRGRWFTGEEFVTSADVAIVDTAAAHLLWPGREAIGQVVKVGSRTLEVIGVMTPVRAALDRSPTPRVIVPSPATTGSGRLVAWSPDGTASDLLPRISAAVSAAVPGATATVRTMTLDSEFERSIGEARFQTPVVLTFGVLATMLAGIGIFGLVSHLVEQRTREFGIRLAIGATRQHIWFSVIREAVVPALAGLALGSAGALALETVVTSTVFGWQSSGAVAVAVVVVILLSVAVLAALIPAARATRVDPALTLRAE